MPYNELTGNLITAAVNQINVTAENQAKILRAMKDTAKSVPEYCVVIEMAGIGEIRPAQFIAGIGDINRLGSRIE